MSEQQIVIPGTPYLRIDLPRVRENLARLSAYTAEHGIGVRPHTKTHKSVKFASLQMEAGAVGLTVAKIGEAQVMAPLDADLLVAYPAIDPVRRQALAELAREHPVHCAVDSTLAGDVLDDAAAEAGSVIGILVDLDVGLGRTGVQSPEQARALGEYVAGRAHLRLDGLFCYPGQVWAATDRQGPALGAVEQRLAATLELWRAAGLEASIVSGGSTPTAYQSHLMPSLTEIRPGTYIFNDMNTVHGGFCTLEQCAASIVTTVISDAAPGQVVLDAGSKTLSSDRCIPALESGYGYVLEYPQAIVGQLSEEHAQVDIRNCEAAPRLGEQLTVIPNHVCPCVNLQTTMWIQDGETGLTPRPVDARGLLS